MTDTCVLDASGLLAVLHGEPGADVVSTILAATIVSAVNWSEVLQKARTHGVAVDGLESELTDLGVTFVPFASAEAETAADLWHGGLRSISFADRACLATGIVRGLPVLTADRAWADLPVAIPVRIIR